MIWLVLMGFGFVEGVETVIVLEARTGVVRLPAGRDKSAGLMSGILAGGRQIWRLDDESEVEAGRRSLQSNCGGVACSEEAYRNAAQGIIPACEETPELCDHDLSVGLMD